MWMENQWIKKHTFIRLRIKLQAHTQIREFRNDQTRNDTKLKTVTQHFCRPRCRPAGRSEMHVRTPASMRMRYTEAKPLILTCYLPGPPWVAARRNAVVSLSRRGICMASLVFRLSRVSATTEHETAVLAGRALPTEIYGCSLVYLVFRKPRWFHSPTFFFRASVTFKNRWTDDL